MALKAVLFDLDGTLLPMDMETFVTGYLKLLAKKMAPCGYEPEALTGAIWAGTEDMLHNHGLGTNYEVFWRRFKEFYPDVSSRDEELFDEFYANEFSAARDFCGFAPQAREALDLCHSLGLRTALATNPLFPAVATYNRLGWAGLRPEDFEVITTYEDQDYVKPSREYYLGVLGKMGLEPGDCLMVGNDTTEDLGARDTGMEVFILTDCLINREGVDLARIPHGSWRELMRYIRSLAEMDRVMAQKRLFLFDMDGTLYLGEQLYPFTKALLAKIRETGRRYLFMTNNSSRSVEAYIEKLGRLGIEARREDFITSSQATALYLHRHHELSRLYVCGTESLKAELRREGFAVTERPEETDVIVLGFDTELTFQKLRDVSFLLCTRPGIPYIATNPDLVCPTEFGSVPDCGSVTIMLENVSRRRPVVIGKPEPMMPLLAMEKTGFAPSETCVIGDRLYTDAASGLNAGVTAVLVMGGEADYDTICASDILPDIIMKDAGEILRAL
ncbi:MAG: HAD family hydrolase [Oscillospiraceae bacterium]|nr:HAD family hydrolase [Oscillospiraceae bacterium]